LLVSLFRLRFACFRQGGGRSAYTKRSTSALPRRMASVCAACPVPEALVDLFV